ncbi:hypothetical protein ABS735_26055 [Streptomyces sp. MMCC 100]|uniref:hypothetical protein n=1 Tax=Streptomyces sp. MMCC 100 TaxID=3163555 RepID=UPI00359507F6
MRSRATTPQGTTTPRATTAARAWATARRADGPQGKGRAGGRPPGRARLTGVLLILLSLASAAACCLVFAWWLPSDGERYQDYRAADSCSSGALSRGDTDCLSTWHLTVEKTVNKTAGKESVHDATLTYQDSWRGTVHLNGSGPLLERLEPGDRVTATAWRGEIMVLGQGGVRQDTLEAPRDELQMNAAVGVLAGLLAAQCLVFGAVRLVRPLDHEPLTWEPYGRWLLFTVIGVSFGVGLPAVWTGVPWWTVPLVAVPLAMCAALWFRFRLRLRRYG